MNQLLAFINKFFALLCFVAIATTVAGCSKSLAIKASAVMSQQSSPVSHDASSDPSDQEDESAPCSSASFVEMSDDQALQVVYVYPFYKHVAPFSPAEVTELVGHITAPQPRPPRIA